MLNYNVSHALPSSEELPSSDNTPVDNELQIFIPNLLLSILALIWQEREDWFFGINMGIYYDIKKPAIVPDAFLSLDVERFVGEEGRFGYAMWDEDRIVPILALEVLFETSLAEYARKTNNYAKMGILYYAIYAPTRQRRNRQRLEVHRLVDGKYVLQSGDRIWMPEIGLGIGGARGTFQGLTREWLYWYDRNGNRYPTPEELARQKQQQLEQTQEQLGQTQEQFQALLAKLQQRGIDPNSL